MSNRQTKQRQLQRARRAKDRLAECEAILSALDNEIEQRRQKAAVPSVTPAESQVAPEPVVGVWGGVAASQTRRRSISAAGVRTSYRPRWAVAL